MKHSKFWTELIKTFLSFPIRNPPIFPPSSGNISKNLKYTTPLAKWLERTHKNMS